MDNNQGWIMISRNITDMKGYFDEKFTRVMAWIDLLLLAEWRPKRTFYLRGNKITLKRGQLAISVRELCERWQWSNKTVIERLKEFEADGRISIERSNLINVITITNYDKYQNYTTNYTTKQTDSEVVNDVVENVSTPQITQQTTQQTTQHLNNSKKNNNNNTHTIAREGEEKSGKELWREQLEQSELFWEQTAVALHRSVSWLRGLLPSYHAESIACNLSDYTYSDYRRRFFNYARKESQRYANQTQPTTSGSSRKGSSAASLGGHGLNE